MFSNLVGRRSGGELMDDYAAWRNACFAVERAARAWRAAASPREQALAHAAYAAALAQEEAAADGYRDSLVHESTPRARSGVAWS